MPDFIKEKYNQWRQISGEYQHAFLSKHDPEVIIEFLKKHSFALKETWVVCQVTKWLLNDRNDLLKRGFLPRRGEQNERNRKKIEYLIIVNEINKLIKKGFTKTQAFEEYANRSHTLRSIEGVRNIYYRTLRQKPEIYVSDNGNKISISVFPAKIEFDVNGYKQKLFGSWTIEVNK